MQVAAARWYDDMPDVLNLTAEALAAKEGLELAAENGYDHVVLEIDYRGLKILIEEFCCFSSRVVYVEKPTRWPIAMLVWCRLPSKLSFG